MKISIEKIRIHNFKAISSLEVVFDGKDTSVFGRNATGKTTLFDAFTWCLFSRDSADRTDFWVKPHSKNGEEVHNLETIVEVSMVLDEERRVDFSHMMVENWVKKNGQADRVYSGNTHKYWVNGVSVSAGEYEKNVEQIVKPEVFRLITNPMAFNAIKWEKRREFLLKLSNTNIDSLLLSRPCYEHLKTEMEQRSTDVYGLKKVKAEQKKRDEQELAQIPVRVSELTSILKELGSCDTEKADARLIEIETELSEIENAMNDGTDIIAQINQKAKELAEAEGKRSYILTSLNRAHSDAKLKAKTECVTIQSQLRVAKATLSDITNRIERTETQIDEKTAEIEELRAKWYQIDDEKLPEHKVTTVCPTCGQQLPEAQISSAEEKYLESFEADKQLRAERVSKQGKSISEELARLQDRKARDEAEANKARTTIAELEPKLEALTAESKLYDIEPDYSDNEEIRAANEKIREKQSAYEEAISMKKPVDERLVSRKKSLTDEKNELTKVSANKRQHELCETRIASLEKHQAELGIRVADTEQFLMLIDRFVSERCKALEMSVNSLFPSVKWKLFDTQINGGIRDCCDCLVEGVQFSDANNAAKINAGLEIIDVLSKHYGVSVPVFVDNAEAVNALKKIESQRIALFVTLYDDTLRFEHGIKNGEEEG